MKQKYLDLWCRFVLDVASLSSCERLQVGAVLVSLDGCRSFSYGYNGTCKGQPNIPPNANTPGNPYYIHAEQNVISRPRDNEPAVMIVTHQPCITCASLIINNDIHSVYALSEYRDPTGWNLLRDVLGDRAVLLKLKGNQDATQSKREGEK